MPTLSTGLILAASSFATTTLAFVPSATPRAPSMTSFQSLPHVDQSSLTQCNSLPVSSSLMVSDAVASSALAIDQSSPLMTYFLQTLIANGVPALCSIIVIFFAALAFRRSSNNKRNDANPFNDRNRNPASMLYDDLYGDQQQEKKMPPFLKFLSGGNAGPPGLMDRVNNKNVGIPKETFIKLTNLNRKYDSFQYSMTAATQSKAAAASQFRQAAFGRALQKAFATSGGDGSAGLTTNQQARLLEWEATLLKEGGKLIEELTRKQTELTTITFDLEMQDLGMDTVYQLDANTLEANVTSNATATTVTSNSSTAKKASAQESKKQITELQKDLDKLQKDIQKFETEALKNLLQIAGSSHAAALRTAWLGNISVRGTGSVLQDLQERPLKSLFSPDVEGTPAGRPVLYVSRFPGDTTASQVATLREEVTAIVRNAKPNDEALIVLQTGGGTVTGYGLAAAQLQRLKNAGLKLTIAVEQVAASGGYMMCCVADRIVASPFAVLGSIGVITDIPNVYERLKNEGIEFQTVTAGKYKRTLTPTKKPTKEDFQKTKADVEDILVLFRDWVATNRPQLDIERVATGETWFGKDAMDLKLCDEILPVDDVFTDYVDRGFDVFEVEYSPPDESPLGALLSPATSASNDEDAGIIGNSIRWVVRTIATEVRKELGSIANVDKPVEQRYMARSEDAERVKTEA